MTVADFYNIFSGKFLTKIAMKNSWGKNELELLYHKTMAETAAEYLIIKE